MSTSKLLLGEIWIHNKVKNEAMKTWVDFILSFGRVFNFFSSLKKPVLEIVVDAHWMRKRPLSHKKSCSFYLGHLEHLFALEEIGQYVKSLSILRLSCF